jgi:predicted negative regulator of RcsB-dependent stress response
MSATMEAAKPTSPAKSALASAPGFLSVPTNRYLLAGGTVVLLALIGWFVVLSGQRKEAFASRALDEARSVAEQGNLPLAASDLQKVVTTYAGTRAAQEAVITLNQVRLVNGQTELAAVGLQEFLKAGPDAHYKAPAYSLLGRALENSRRPADAAEAYLNASAAAEVDYLRADLLLDAARAFTDAGQRDKAIEAYRRIVKDYSKTSSRAEAEVRLAELTASAM